jgi:curved DNA-binding protein CbpA
MKNPLDTTFDHKDPYRILGVTAHAAPDAIRRAYLELAKRNHQDLFATDPEKYRSTTLLMQDINSAYELLSDPARRELWNRSHPGAPSRPAPRKAPRPAPKQSVHSESGQVHLVIRKYNEFVDSLRTAAQRQEAARKIRQFQASRDGSAYIRKLVASQYQEVIDILNLDRRVDRPISVFDDGLVEIMLLYPGALEVSPSEVFITYAYLLHRQNRGKVPAAPGTAKPKRRGAGSGDFRVSTLRLRQDPDPTGPAPAKDIGARIWDWLLSKPGPRHR